MQDDRALGLHGLVDLLGDGSGRFDNCAWSGAHQRLNACKKVKKDSDVSFSVSDPVIMNSGVYISENIAPWGEGE